MLSKILSIILLSTLTINIPAFAEDNKTDLKTDIITEPTKTQLNESTNNSNLKFGGFIDTYYSYDFNNPFDMNRVYTTQPLRHNEFNLNLAYLDGKYNSDNIRGRFALQTGTYVESNYALESQLLKNILEASAGFKIIDNLWLDAGIFPSHIGFEGIVSKDNWNYSRSLMADYSPYYESGVKLSAVFNDKLSAQLLLLNGWQNIKETNNSKAVGTQIQYKPLEQISLTYNTFIGNEAPDNSPFQLRFFNDFIIQYAILPQWEIATIFDIGIQQKSPDSGGATWFTGAIQTRYKITPKLTIAGRIEHYNDKEQIIVTTKTINGFQVSSASLNLDYAFNENLLYRIEGRVFQSADKIFTTNIKDNPTNTDAFLVTSLAFSF